jgi:hypothetical protein
LKLHKLLNVLVVSINYDHVLNLFKQVSPFFKCINNSQKKIVMNFIIYCSCWKFPWMESNKMQSFIISILKWHDTKSKIWSICLKRKWFWWVCIGVLVKSFFNNLKTFITSSSHLNFSLPIIMFKGEWSLI